MKAVVWHGKEDVRVDTVPDPAIQEPTDAIVRITSTAICGSDLHLYAKFPRPVMREGDILGHEPMGIVEEVGADVTDIAPGDRVVVPFNIACGTCFMCERGLQSQCETTQNRRYGKGGSLFGYTHLDGAVPGGQAELLRVPLAHYGADQGPRGARRRAVPLPLRRPPDRVAGGRVRRDPRGRDGRRLRARTGGPDVRADRPHLGAARVIGVDQVPERLAMAHRHGVETVDFGAVGDVVQVIRAMMDDRGADSVIDAVGMEAEGSSFERVLQAAKLQADRFRRFAAPTTPSAAAARSRSRGCAPASWAGSTSATSSTAR